MPKLHDRWTVLPHGPLRQIDEGLLTVVGQIPMPLGNFPRRMTVIGLSEERTLLFSPISLEEAEMDRIEQLGKPAFLVIPSGAHRLDARPFKARYPKARVVAPSGARAAVEEAVKVDLVTGRFGDPAAELVNIAGTGNAEAALAVHRPAGMSLIVNDIIAHVTHPKGMGARIMAKLFGFGSNVPAVPRPIRQKLVSNPLELAAQFDEWAEMGGRLRRIVPSHGEIIENQPPAVLRRLAIELKN